MDNDANPVLVNFSPVRVAKPVTQRFALEVTAFGMARSYCKLHGVTSRDGKDRVMAEMHNKFEQSAVSPKLIKQRQLVFFPRLSDIRIVDGDMVLAEPAREHLRIFSGPDDTKGVDLKTRHQYYGKIVGDCLAEMYGAVERAPDDLIHVTSSGYLAPSPVERLVVDRAWSSTTVSHAYHMGCHGAFPAIRMAHGYLATSRTGITLPKERVDIVHTELLSGHHDIEIADADNIIKTSLFADGFINYALCTPGYVRKHGLRGLRVLAFGEHLVPDSTDDMTWVPGPYRFEMRMSDMVAVIVRRQVYKFVDTLLARIGMDFESAKARLVFAIHPAGPTTLDDVQDELDLSDEQVAISKTVFYENGNMSSATMPHILQAIADEGDIACGARVVCLGFGPGLTLSGLVLEKT